MGRIHSLIIVVVSFCSICLLNSALAESSQNLPCLQEYYHDWQDGSYDVATQNGYVYLACGTEGVHVLDISDLNAIHDVAHITEIPAMTAAVAGNRLYLGSSGVGVYSYDISDPTHPVQVELIQLSSVTTINSIRVQGNYLCVCGSSNSGQGLSFVELGSGDAFRLLWSSQAITVVTDIEIRDHLAYVGAGSKLLVLDISDAGAPVAIDSLVGERWQEVLGLALMGNYAYLASGDAGFRVMDLSSHEIVAALYDMDPLVPTDEDYPIDVRISGTTAYVHYNIYSCPLAIIDVSDPVHPVVLSNYYPADNISKFVIDGSNVFVADLTAGLRVLDVTDSNHPVETHSFDDRDWDMRIAGVKDGIAYVQQTNRVMALDLSNPQQPRERGVLALGSSPFTDPYSEQVRGLEVVGTYGYCLKGMRLVSFDLTDPDHLAVLDSMDEPQAGTWNGTYSFGFPYAYLPNDTGFAIINVSNPHDMQMEGNTDRITDLYHLPVSGYMVRATNQGLFLCSLEIIRAPQWIGPFPLTWTSSSAVCGQVDGDKFYLATSDKLAIYSMEDRHLLSATTIVEPPSEGRGISDFKLVNHLAYLSVYGGGIEVYDVSDPQAVARTGYHESAIEAISLFVSGSFVYVAARTHVAVFEYLGPASDGSARELQPRTCDLEPNFPNPFNATTTIGFDLPNAGPMSLTIYNALGQKVVTLADGFRPAGHYQLQWDGSSSTGGVVASGVYVYRLQAGPTVMNRKMTLLH